MFCVEMTVTEYCAVLVRRSVTLNKAYDACSGKNKGISWSLGAYKEINYSWLSFSGLLQCYFPRLLLCTNI